VVVAAVAVSALGEYEYQNQFTRWVAQNDKAYTHEEFFHRYNTFKANVDLIAAHNAKNASYTLAVNKFADLNTAEFGAQMCGFKRQLSAQARFPTPFEQTVAPAAEVDWVKAGAVTPIKDQGQCGSCWAFSATGGQEGAWFIAKKALVSVSEQELVDCAGSFGNQGCNGGLMTQAYDYVISKGKTPTSGGLATETAYPYTARDGQCKDVKTRSSPISSHKDVDASEAALLEAVTRQPIPVAIEADQSCFQFYHSGILDDPSCGTNLDHGVLAVGYGTEGGKDYWRIKNSWGTSWGDNGFIRFARGQRSGEDINQCGVTLMSTYPIV